MAWRDELKFLAGAVGHGYDPYAATTQLQELFDERDARRQAKRDTLTGLIGQIGEYASSGELTDEQIQALIGGMATSSGLGPNKMAQLQGTLGAVAGPTGATGEITPEDVAEFNELIAPQLENLYTGGAGQAMQTGSPVSGAPHRAELRALAKRNLAIPPESESAFDTLFDNWYETKLTKPQYEQYQELAGGPPAPGGGLSGLAGGAAKGAGAGAGLYTAGRNLFNLGGTAVTRAGQAVGMTGKGPGGALTHPVAPRIRNMPGVRRLPIVRRLQGTAGKAMMGSDLASKLTGMTKFFSDIPEHVGSMRGAASGVDLGLMPELGPFAGEGTAIENFGESVGGPSLEDILAAAQRGIAGPLSAWASRTF